MIYETTEYTSTIVLIQHKNLFELYQEIQKLQRKKWRWGNFDYDWICCYRRTVSDFSLS